MRIEDLYYAIKAICPIDGVSCGKLDDSTTWEIQFSPVNLPTVQQKTAAYNILDNFIIDPTEAYVDPVQGKLDALQTKLAQLETKVEIVEDKVDTAIEPK